MARNRDMGCHLVLPMAPHQEPMAPQEERMVPQEERMVPLEERTEPQEATLQYSHILQALAWWARHPPLQWPTLLLQLLMVPQGSSPSMGHLLGTVS